MLMQNALLLHPDDNLIRAQSVGMHSVFVNLKSFYFCLFSISSHRAAWKGQLSVQYLPPSINL